jgi:hypothetical protein
MLFSGRIVDLVQTIRREFEERTDLRLTPAEASERWNREPSTLQNVLDAFVSSGYLLRSPQGVYTRRAGPALE